MTTPPVVSGKSVWTEEGHQGHSPHSVYKESDMTEATALMHTVKSTGINLDFPLASEIQGGVVGTFNL